MRRGRKTVLNVQIIIFIIKTFLLNKRRLKSWESTNSKIVLYFFFELIYCERKPRFNWIFLSLQLQFLIKFNWSHLFIHLNQNISIKFFVLTKTKYQRVFYWYICCVCVLYQFSSKFRSNYKFKWTKTRKTKTKKFKKSWTNESKKHSDIYPTLTYLLLHFTAWKTSHIKNRGE